MLNWEAWEKRRTTRWDECWINIIIPARPDLCQLGYHNTEQLQLESMNPGLEFS